MPLSAAELILTSLICNTTVSRNLVLRIWLSVSDYISDYISDYTSDYISDCISDYSHTFVDGE